jgi:hypothetical protein
MNLEYYSGPDTDEEHVVDEQPLTDKEKFHNRNLHQIKLAGEIWKYLYGKSDMDSMKKGANTLWTQDEEGSLPYNDIYRIIEADQKFKDHHRLKGNRYNLTTRDIIEYRKTYDPKSGTGEFADFDEE